MNNAAIQKILANRPVMVVLMLSVAAGAIVSVAAGFVMTFKLITFIGN
jgi:hypothetical protein